MCVFAGAVALAVRQDSRGANSSHVVVPSANDPDNSESNNVSSSAPGSVPCGTREHSVHFVAMNLSQKALQLIAMQTACEILH